MSEFCQRHSSFFCPCAKPYLYRREPERIESWGLSNQETMAVLDRAERLPGGDLNDTALAERPWPNILPSPIMLEWAGAKVAVDDDQKSNNLRNIADPQTRKDGYVAEAVFNAWLDQQGVQHVWNGGADPLPDFVIGDTEIAFRACATRSTLSKLNFIYIFEAQAKGPQQRFFGYVNRTTGRHYLVGGITLDLFMEKARRYKIGDELQPGFICRHPMLVRSLACLTEPADWLASL